MAWVWPALVVGAAVVGAALTLDSIRWSSATYDEVAYLRLAARWWRTGQQDEITRMGSPLLFWKLQQAPVLWVLDRTGRGALIDDPIRHQETLLPLVRAGALWIWLLPLGLCAWWARLLYGPKAMALAAWLFALGPNLIAHGGLVTMELPLLACTTGMSFLFWRFLCTGRRGWRWASAALGGVAFSCKFTTVLFPPILAVAWWLDGWRRGQAGLVRLTRTVALGMVSYILILIAANLACTGFALLPLSTSRGAHPSIATRYGSNISAWIARLYETPIPQEWAGFATQVHHQLSGGPSYLLGERRTRGWSYYYLVALAVKVPLGFWLLLAGRLALEKSERDGPRPRDDLLPQAIVLFLVITAIGSSRNYGLRYLLPLAPLAIVWVSRIAEWAPGGESLRAAWPRWIVTLGLAGQALAVASIHPFELTYFNVLAGGPLGGRHVLSDSNLDWGQGLKGLARLQRAEPEFRDLTLYYFGDTDPSRYGVEGASHVVTAVADCSQLPPICTVTTRYVAVSASLQWGPWGPPGFFAELNGVAPVRMTDDTTIAIYRRADLAPRP
jgi:4-amino-4-deoxy-L-arabinose transferase-like glycosyltransferase